MKRSLHLALSQYKPIPTSLQGASVGKTKDVIEVDLAGLYHHYYLDTLGSEPPSPDPAQFEHLRFLMPSEELRFQGEGVGASTNAKRSKSSEMGQAFCRWFLHEHLGIKYFAHMDSLIGANRPEFHGFSVQRAIAGDIPDYLCSDGSGSVVLAEAKGRYTSIGFGTAEFNRWRQQFTRVKVLDETGTPVKVKGHIVATRFATESKPKVKSKLYAEDPSTEGQEPISRRTARLLSRQVVASHYADVLLKLDQPLLAHAIRRWLPLDSEIRIFGAIWEFAVEGYHRQFVGGYYAGTTDSAAIELVDNRIVRRNSDALRLGLHTGTFVGIELSVFKHLVNVSRSDSSLLDEVPEVDPIRDVYSGISMLRDGSIIGPLQMFVPRDFAAF
ncbi:MULTISPECIES: hypothetical protein [Pseudomonas]|uniref:hypothetical protein n=1 Tax=Pseudomonas TaxID=286 RepID=UPI0023619FBA|nr:MULTISPECIES: hypothetical protein [Pseudomonas]WJV25576.1 hypothetical protein PSR66_05925 [Pseudomonas chlororaphis]